MEPPSRGWRPSDVKLSKTGPFLLILGAALAVSCGGVTSAPHAAKSSGTPAVSGQPTGTPEQRAAADARAILGQFIPPPGAVRLPKRPALPSGSATMGLDSTTVVDAVGYWRVSGAATALQAWEKAHISRSFSRQDVIIGPPSLEHRVLAARHPRRAGHAGDERAVLRRRRRRDRDHGGRDGLLAAAAAGSEVIPDSVTVVTIATAGPWQGNPAPVTITSVPVVRRLAALVNGLPVSTVGRGVPCSMAAGFTLTFRAAAGGPAVAVADRPAECGVVHLRLGGKDEPALQPPGSYPATVLKIAGLRWKLD